jgi:hypothetical protein
MELLIPKYGNGASMLHAITVWAVRHPPLESLIEGEASTQTDHHEGDPPQVLFLFVIAPFEVGPITDAEGSLNSTSTRAIWHSSALRSFDFHQR